MERINLFLLDLSYKNTTNGVDRYVGILFDALKAHPLFRVHWIHFVCDDTVILHRTEQDGKAVKVTVPWPQQADEILLEKFWTQKYNQQAFRIVEPLFVEKNNCILHVHILNLIDFALEVKKHVPCKIVTHLHCIPWKELYNSDLNRFNLLYNMYECFQKGRRIFDHSDVFLTSHSEKSAYFDSDHIICLTRCARDFLTRIMEVSPGKISLIPNGMNDSFESDAMSQENSSGPFRFIYAGVLSKSKGVHWILDALRLLRQRGYEAALTVAGAYNSQNYTMIKTEYEDINVDLLGRIPYEVLKRYYARSDAGVIASVKDQSSLVALEMAMFGLPVVVTAIEGLDETFTDQVDALKVRASYSRLTGLSTDVGDLARQMARMIDDGMLRRTLARNARKLYETRYTLSLMLERTIYVFQRTLQSPGL